MTDLLSIPHDDANDFSDDNLRLASDEELNAAMNVPRDRSFVKNSVISSRPSDGLLIFVAQQGDGSGNQCDAMVWLNGYAILPIEKLLAYLDGGMPAHVRETMEDLLRTRDLQGVSSEPVDHKGLYTRPPEGLTREQHVERLRELVREHNEQMKDSPGYVPIVVPEGY